MMDLITLGKVVALAACILLVSLATSIVVVPEQHVALVERWGKHRRTLNAGLNFIAWPIDRLRTVRWTYIAEGYPGRQVRKVVETAHIDTRYRNMDIMPVRCQTEDAVYVTINGKLTYKVADPTDAVYKVEDPLEGIVDIANEALMESVRGLKAADAKPGELDRLVEKRLADKSSGLVGVEITKFTIQTIDFGDAMRSANAEEYAASRREMMQRSMQDRQHENRMVQLVHEAEQQARALEKQRNEVESQCAMKLHKAKVDAQIKWTLLEPIARFYKELGLSGADAAHVLGKREDAELVANYRGQTLVLGTGEGGGTRTMLPIGGGGST